MNSGATRAAIKRASQAARNAMQQLDAQSADELLQIYEAAAEHVRGLIRAAGDGNDLVPVARLRELLRQIEDVIDATGARRDELLGQWLEDAAGLGVRPYTGAGQAATGIHAQAVVSTEAGMRINQEAVRFVQSLAAADGLRLSDRLWRLDRGAKEVLTRAVGQAVVNGWDAATAARQAMVAGEPVGPYNAGRLGAAKTGELVHLADMLHSGDGSEAWKAQRVMRTEINRAHGTAYMTGAEKTPGFVGFRFLLSPNHPKPDICDLLARQNLYGLGPGVYPTSKLCPWPAHPNTMSFVEMVFGDEVTEADRAGKETVTEAMGRMPADVREGVLGQEKAALWDEGRLSAGAIRSPLYAVRARLARTGR